MINEFNDGPLTLDEMIKIMSLMENPPEAAMVRKALRFYEPPAGLEVNWGSNKRAWDTMNHFANPQNPEELAWMLQFIEGKTSLLEIGSSFGGTLRHMAAVMRPGSRIVSVDLDCDSTPRFLNPLASLKDTCKKISWKGGNVELFIGDSHSAQIIEAVSNYGPFDFVFIDGDHTYEGVKQDWENYGPMGKIVGFHDIGVDLKAAEMHGVQGCVDFWNELKASGEYRCVECLGKESPKFGIGLVFRE